MKIDLQLFGAFRQHQPDGRVRLDVPERATVADVREALERHARLHWPTFHPALLASAAFASEATVLREHEAVPANGRMAVLPPVSGG